MMFDKIPTLYLNENTDAQLVRELAKFKIKAIHTQDVHNKGRSDEFQLDYALRRKYILVSHDRADYRRLYNKWVFEKKGYWKSIGIIIMSQGEPRNLAQRIKLFFEQKYSCLSLPFCEVPPKI